MSMSHDQHVATALRDAYDHAVRQAQDVAGKAHRAEITAAELREQAADWAGRRDALRWELDKRVDGIEAREALDRPAVPTLASTGPDLMASGGRPMRTSPLGPR